MSDLELRFVKREQHETVGVNVGPDGDETVTMAREIKVLQQRQKLGSYAAQWCEWEDVPLVDLEDEKSE